MITQTRLKKVLFFLLTLTACTQVNENPLTVKYEMQSIPSKASIRAMDVVSDEVVWLGGTGGTVVYTTDAGEVWHVKQISGAESMDFRDIVAFSDKEAMVVSAGSPARIYKTEDGGENWTLLYENNAKEIFLNGMEFWNPQAGIAFGDPIDGKLFVLRTEDGGVHWDTLQNRPRTMTKEAGFAASGSSMVVAGDSTVWIGLGGPKSRVFKSVNRGLTWDVRVTPMLSGTDGPKGIYGMHFMDEQKGFAVGGNYTDSTENTFSYIYTEDGGNSWQNLGRESTSGYKSSIKAVPNSKVIVAVSRYGTDISMDRGKHWKKLDKAPFYVHEFVPSGKFGWAAGAHGRIAKLKLQ
ncbi:WD40/YVTN/BNR-like repeat-containing protein [Algivirga pacifica]|uniref:Oxidoreductase n=1 Tax=Algivirga pacifica TaxID=1162670 RepID=A0ABP9D3I9_9BACT